MRRYLPVYLLLSSIALFSCRSVYKGLIPVERNADAIMQFKPRFSSELYKASVDVVGNHLSGILLIKQMPDSSMRLVFSNEMGLKFFDFEYNANGFNLHYIMPKMNKKAVITTLQKDLELILFQLDASTGSVYSGDGLLYFRYKQPKGYNYYITDQSVTSLVRIERSSTRKPVAEVIMLNYKDGVPDSIGITHKNFNFTIGLKRIER